MTNNSQMSYIAFKRGRHKWSKCYIVRKPFRCVDLASVQIYNIYLFEFIMTNLHSSSGISPLVGQNLSSTWLRK